ncbi:mucin-2-like [Cyprinodon tularosa]|uniref:mucin-2-like n=1 Tax=Cyprinodon tularosa TaxID=77115 RepID=UPI0018E22E91|nr:mucin-2-like [Cyprinodon tularosa]
MVSLKHFPLEIDNVTEIQDITVTTVCVSTDAGFQCECEEQFAWPYSTCITYGACDSISGGICTCIKGFPADGSSCQLISELLVQTEYEIDVELNVTDVATVDFLRILLNNGSAFTTNTVVNVTQIAFTTVCSPIGGGYQCRCEDQYRWSCDQCQTYGSCDNITGDTCGCINGIPADGQYCQSLDQYNFTNCSDTTTAPPPFVYLYILHVELNSTDVEAVRELRKISYPISINSYIEISDVNITTVCSPIGGGYQCRCEDQYRWSCDQCQTYGSCDNITGDTCGCINGIPADGQYCQSLDQYNFTNCSDTTTAPPPFVYLYILHVELNSTDVAAVIELSKISYPISINSYIEISDVNISTVCSPIGGGYQCRCEDQYRWSCDQCQTYGSCDNITGDTCGCINGIPADGQYCQSLDQYNFTNCSDTTTAPPPFVYLYILHVELNSTDVEAVRELRKISYPISINSNIEISDVNISTVCSPIGGGYQCRCEDQYRWSCDQCQTYGSCDNITGDTCGCINGIPADGQYCQSLDQYKSTTPTPPINTTFQVPTRNTSIASTTAATTKHVTHQYNLFIELKTTDDAAVGKIRNLSFTISINNDLQISDLKISTVCFPNNTTYQCRCEDQYAWPCDMCSTFGECSNIQDNTCRCINALPPNDTYCQPLSELDTCRMQTTIGTTTITPFVNTSTSDSATTASTFGTSTQAATNATTNTTALTDSTTEASTGFNTTAPTTLVTDSLPVFTNATTTTPQPMTSSVTNSTTEATTGFNTTTPTTLVTDSLPVFTNATTTTPQPMTSSVTNSTTEATTWFNTTTPTTLVTDSLPVFTNATTATPQPMTSSVTNSTTEATTWFNTTTPTTLVTDSLPVFTNATTATTQPMTSSVTNSTTEATTGFNTTTPTTLVTDSLPVFTNATTATPQPMTSSVTNSTTEATTGFNTTTPTTLVTDSLPVFTNATTATPQPMTSSVTNSTTEATTGFNTTTPTTLVTDSTTEATTWFNTTTPTTLVTDSLPVFTNATTTTPQPMTSSVTNSTTEATTGFNTTTPTTLVTDSLPVFTNATTATPQPMTSSVTNSLPVFTNATTTTPQPMTSSVTTTTTEKSTPAPSTSASTTSISASTATSMTSVSTTTTTASPQTTLTTTSAPSTKTTTTTTNAPKPSTSSTKGTTALASTTITSERPVEATDIPMSVELDLEFIDKYNDKTSQEFRDLSSRIAEALGEPYTRLTGYIGVSVTDLRPGSVIADFTVKMSGPVDLTEITEANSRLDKALGPIARVLATPTAEYNT